MASLLAAGAPAFGWYPLSCLAPQAIDIGTARIIVQSPKILGFASARGEIVGFQSKVADPAASKDAIPKGASPLAAGGQLAFALAENFA